MLGNNLKPLTHQPIRHFVLSQQYHPQHLFLALLSWGFFCPQANIHCCKEKKQLWVSCPTPSSLKVSCPTSPSLMVSCPTPPSLSVSWATPPSLMVSRPTPPSLIKLTHPSTPDYKLSHSSIPDGRLPTHPSLVVSHSTPPFLRVSCPTHPSLNFTLLFKRYSPYHGSPESLSDMVFIRFIRGTWNYISFCVPSVATLQVKDGHNKSFDSQDLTTIVKAWFTQ